MEERKMAKIRGDGAKQKDPKKVLDMIFEQEKVIILAIKCIDDNIYPFSILKDPSIRHAIDGVHKRIQTVWDKMYNNNC